VTNSGGAPRSLLGIAFGAANKGGLLVHPADDTSA
jgi:hypothetical protein